MFCWERKIHTHDILTKSFFVAIHYIFVVANQNIMISLTRYTVIYKIKGSSPSQFQFTFCTCETSYIRQLGAMEESWR